MSERLPLLPGYLSARKITDQEFYELALKAIQRRTGLIHGTFKKGKQVCAVAAVNNTVVTSVGVSKAAIDLLQGVNDSVPEGTPAERRQIVIQWLQSKIGEVNGTV